MRPILLSWSGGKDCALALSELRMSGQFEVVELSVGICTETGRVPMHEVPRELIRSQAAAMGLPLYEIELPARASNVQYEAAWSEYYLRKTAEGIRQVAFGDLFLEEIRAYREVFLSRLGMEPVFPIWGRSTSELARQAIADGLKAVVCSCDPRRLPCEFVGRMFNDQFLNELPSAVDPCGENGEFHTFVFNHLAFRHPVAWRFGQIQHLDAVAYIELMAGPSMSLA